MITDGYAQWYADRLWSLVPAIYRSLDAGPTPSSNGPLRELINRIGAQAAVVRQSIDRLSENQSIELCDDWVIPYIGDLVATRLVSCLDANAQRIDVAKTIYYRRRAGTLGILEELAADIATIDARCVEFFRRLGRTRHQFDPPLSYQIENAVSGPIGFTSGALEIAEGLIGPYSGTPAGGFADLRNRYAASNTGNAFDEFAYTADLRAPIESLGWYNIRNLGVFLWWLEAFPIAAATPVSGGGNPATGVAPCFTFDPSGRDLQLFAPSQRAATSQTAEEFWGENWASPDEWVLPVAIRSTLWEQLLLDGSPELLYTDAFWVGLLAGGTSVPVPVSTVIIHPERGRFSFPAGAPVGTITVNYSFGLLLAIGAGGYNDDILSDLALPAVTATVTGGVGGAGLNPPLAALAANATLQIDDSLTYTGPTQTLTIPAGCTVAITAQSGQRPVLRWTTGTPAAPATWTITGNGGAGSGTPTVLILEGLWLVGADIILTGTFDAVYLRTVTLDPGTATAPGSANFFETAIDGQPLAPSTLWIEGSVTNLVIERSITGPIRTRNGGIVATLTATDSVIQAIPTHAVTITSPMVADPALFDAAALAASLKFQTNPLAVTALTGDAALSTALEAYAVNTVPDAALITLMLTAIQQFSQAQAEAAWPLTFADLAIGLAEGAVSLARCTVLGPTYTHLLSASESILDDVATVEDAQAGCVRFTAYASGSTLHQPFRSVQIAPGSPLFRTRDFNEPEYVRLRDDADSFILSAGLATNSCTCANESAAETILEGAQNGSEMGVYCLAQVPLKRRGLALKFEEYAPIGQLPVWIDVD